MYCDTVCAYVYVQIYIDTVQYITLYTAEPGERYANLRDMIKYQYHTPMLRTAHVRSPPVVKRLMCDSFPAYVEHFIVPMHNKNSK